MKKVLNPFNVTPQLNLIGVSFQIIKLHFQLDQESFKGLIEDLTAVAEQVFSAHSHSNSEWNYVHSALNERKENMPDILYDENDPANSDVTTVTDYYNIIKSKLERFTSIANDGNVIGDPDVLVNLLHDFINDLINYSMLVDEKISNIKSVMLSDNSDVTSETFSKEYLDELSSPLKELLVYSVSQPMEAKGFGSWDWLFAGFQGVVNEHMERYYLLDKLNNQIEFQYNVKGFVLPVEYVRSIATVNSVYNVIRNHAVNIGLLNNTIQESLAFVDTISKSMYDRSINTMRVVTDVLPVFSADMADVFEQIKLLKHIDGKNLIIKGM